MTSLTGFDEYIDRLIRIRALSSPSLDGIENGDMYSRRLRENFALIGCLAAENRTFLEERFFPLITADEKLSDEMLETLCDFEEKLLDAENAENLDLPIAYILSERMYKDAQKEEDLLAKFQKMDMQISACYTMMNMTARLLQYPGISEGYRKKGIAIGEYFIELRKKENFSKIESKEGRELILTNARYTIAFFESKTGDRDANEKVIRILDESLAIMEDPFYTELMPDFDWRYYRYRLVGYYSQSTDYSNYRGFDKTYFPKICKYAEEYWDLWHTDPEYFSDLEMESYVEVQRMRNRYLVGKVTGEEYKSRLLQLYRQRDKNLYDIDGIDQNIQYPIELLALTEKERDTQEGRALYIDLFNNVLAYIFHMPNSGVLTFMLELSNHIMRYFTEFPGGIDFEDMMLNLFAAMHPPTYIHSKMVADFAVCLCGHLIDNRPELLVGVEGCRSAEEVVKRRGEILEYTKHAAICHDAGKLSIIDTVFVYGRKLLDMEFELIKTHPKTGAMILKRFPSTAKYADVALGHHRWYDDSRGYPTEFDTSSSPVKTIIDIVACADCLDAATDSIGRSYSRGKSLDELLEEIREGSGTRYAPWAPELMEKPEVRKDIEYLLAEGRDRNYYDTYRLLKSVHEKEK